MPKRKQERQEFSFTGFFMRAEWSDGRSSGERVFTQDGVTTRQVLKDGQWVTVDPAPPRRKRVDAKVTTPKALPAPAATAGDQKPRVRRAPPRPRAAE